MNWGSRIFRIYVYLLFAYLAAPILVTLASSVTTTGYLTFPPPGYSLRWYGAFVQDSAWLEAARTSFVLALYSTGISLGLGGAAAFAVTRRRWRGMGLYQTVLMLPLAFPFSAIGVAIVGVFQSWKIMGTFVSFLLAHILITLPFTYRAVLGSIRSLNPAYYEAALMHGANEWRAFWRVVVPLLRPGVAAGGIFAFIISFDEVTISMLLVGPFLNTLPVKVFSHILESGDPIVAAISSLQVMLAALVLVVSERFLGLRLFTESY